MYYIPARPRERLHCVRASESFKLGSHLRDTRIFSLEDLKIDGATGHHATQRPDDGSVPGMCHREYGYHRTPA
jgi:hypothetical protein